MEEIADEPTSRMLASALRLFHGSIRAVANMAHQHPPGTSVELHRAKPDIARLKMLLVGRPNDNTRLD